MSGTSIDAVDAALCSISGKKISTLSSHSLDIPSKLKQLILDLCAPGPNEIFRLMEASNQFAVLTAKVINELLLLQKLTPTDIRAIGSHGQTIRHIPNGEHPYSLQIGNPNLIAQLTNITTVADFRLADMAAGGQGAPLVPAFHSACFGKPNTTRLIINIGGISNITILPADNFEAVRGYDIGPGNTLLDQWIQKNKNEPFDSLGAWGKSGKLAPNLLKQFMSEPFFQQSPPKSTGREHFNLSWTNKFLTAHPKIANNDIQRTLTELTSQTIANSVRSETTDEPCEIFLCGGGVNNQLIVERLEDLLPHYSINTTKELGIAPQLVEASAFAWLAYRTLSGLPGNITTVTGANKDKILGGIYQASC